MCVWSFCLWLHPQAEKDRFGKHEHETQVWPYMVKPPFHSVLCARRPFTQWGQSLTTHAFVGECVRVCLITSVKHFLLNLVLPRCRRGKKKKLYSATWLAVQHRAWALTGLILINVVCRVDGLPRIYWIYFGPKVTACKIFTTRYQ